MILPAGEADKEIKMKKSNLFLPLVLLATWFLFSSWGSTGHYKINWHAPMSLPYQMSFLKTSWTTLLAAHASDADDRRDTDPSEAPKHYINIDSYPEFNSTGRIPQTYDSVVAAHGISFVLDKGILPWATMTAFDSLRNCFQRKNWDKAALFAADLGHYIADGHQPLHLTQNYNGQYTGQEGVHSRYESSMINRFNNDIVYPYDSAEYIPDINQFVFDYIYFDYKFADSVLLADLAAHSETGSTSSTAYYNALWSHTGDFTIRMFRDASHFLADLIYTAWVDAGSPLPNPNGIDDPPEVFTGLSPNYPNPFSTSTTIPLEIRTDNTPVTLRVYDSKGNLTAILFDGKMNKGHHEIKWNAGNCSEGVYFLFLESGTFTLTGKMILAR